MKRKSAEIDFELLFPGKNIRIKAHEKAIDELVTLITTTNWINPFVVTKNEKGYEILAGERRYHAVKKIREKDPKKFKKVNVEIIEGTELEKFAIQGGENLGRQSLTTYELICYVVELKDKHLLDTTETSKHVGRSTNYVNTMYRLHKKLHPDILEVLSRGKEIPVEDLIDWAKQKPDEQKELYEKWLGKSQPSEQLELEAAPKRKMLPYRKAEKLLNHLTKIKASPHLIMVVKYLMGQRKNLPGKLNPPRIGQPR